MLVNHAASRRILDAQAIESAVEQLAAQIIARCDADARSPQALDANSLAIVGVQTGGAHLARRIAAAIGRTRTAPPVGILDIGLYRDDVFLPGHAAPVLHGTAVDFDVAGRVVVLVDDVLFTGRTIRAALDALLDLGRPTCVRLAILVDRGLRELPIAPDFVGVRVETLPSERVDVRLVEEGAAVDEVLVRARSAT